jgi:hypothetical protein
MFALAAGGLGHALYVALFTAPRWSTFVAYYWITGTLATGLAAGVLLQRYLDLLPSLSVSAKRTLSGVALAGFAAFGAGRAVRSATQAPDDPLVGLARHMAATLPEGSRILVLDAPGRTAWFSGLPVIAMDGLTRDHDFSDEVRNPDLPAWAERNGITHLISYDVPADLPWCRTEVHDGVLTVHFKAPATREPAGTLVFADPPIAHLRDFIEPGTDADGAVAALFTWPERTR